MKATTIKLEGDLLRRLESAKPPKSSLSAFVREALERELRRRRMEDAAQRYLEFLKSNPEERAEADAWEASDLARAPRSSGR